MSLDRLRVIAKGMGYQHVEAFCLMWYTCDGKTSYEGTSISRGFAPQLIARPCGALIRIWNSRDGVTPFGMQCPSCGGDMHHVMHHPLLPDVSVPDHQLHHGQYFWRDATRDDYQWMYRKVLETKDQVFVDALIAEQLGRKQPWLDCHLPEKVTGP